MGMENCGQLMGLSTKGNLSTIRRMDKARSLFHQVRSTLESSKTTSSTAMENFSMRLENQENADFRMEIEQLGLINY